jgi:hypothetical protein
MSSVQSSNGTSIRSGFIAETAQSALASYEPRVPVDETLKEYVERLVALATSDPLTPRTGG